MATRWCGRLLLTPIKQGAIAEGKKISVEKKGWEYGAFKSTFVIHGTRGKISSVKESKNKLYVVAKFEKEKKKQKIKKDTLVKMILKSIDFRRNNLEKLLTRILYFNFTEQDLKRILKHGGKFQRPKAFEGREEGESIYLKVKDKYYEV